MEYLISTTVLSGDEDFELHRRYDIPRLSANWPKATSDSEECMDNQNNRNIRALLARDKNLHRRTV